MKIIICNAFSLSMLNRENQANTHFNSDPRYPRPQPDARGWLHTSIHMHEQNGQRLEVVSAVGHETTAAIFASILGIEVLVNRFSVQLDAEGKRDHDTILLIGQYIGARLPEGATTLPEGAKIEWWTV